MADRSLRIGAPTLRAGFVPLSVLLAVVPAGVAEVYAVAMLTPVGSGSCVLVELPVLLGCAAAHEDDFAGGHTTAGVGELVFPCGSLRGVPAPTHADPRSAVL